jgi:hypothetical protein
MSDDGFDIHAVRHRMKLVRNAGTTELYENRDGVACPACEEPFDDLLVTEEPTTASTRRTGRASVSSGKRSEFWCPPMGDRIYHLDGDDIHSTHRGKT